MYENDENGGKISFSHTYDECEHIQNKKNEGTQNHIIIFIQPLCVHTYVYVIKPLLKRGTYIRDIIIMCMILLLMKTESIQFSSYTHTRSYDSDENEFC